MSSVLQVIGMHLGSAGATPIELGYWDLSGGLLAGRSLIAGSFKGLGAEAYLWK